MTTSLGPHLRPLSEFLGTSGSRAGGVLGWQQQPSWPTLQRGMLVTEYMPEASDPWVQSHPRAKSLVNRVSAVLSPLGHWVWTHGDSTVYRPPVKGLSKAALSVRIKCWAHSTDSTPEAIPHRGGWGMKLGWSVGGGELPFLKETCPLPSHRKSRFFTSGPLTTYHKSSRTERL